MANFIMNFTDADKASFTISTASIDGPVSPTAIGTGTCHTSLRLFGEYAPDYAEKIEENLLHITENFAGPAYPQYAIQGQMWYVTLTFYKDTNYPDEEDGWWFWNGSSWSAISSSLFTVGTGAVETQSVPVGNFYYRTTTNALYQYVNFDGTTPRWRQLRYADGSGTPPTGTINQLKICSDPTATAIDNRWSPAFEGTTSTVSLLTPLDPNSGDFWYNPLTPQLKIYDGSSWDSIIPDTSVFLRLDGTTPMTGNLNMNSHQITGLPATPSGATAATSKAYVDLVSGMGVGTDDVLNNSGVIGTYCTDALNQLDSDIDTIIDESMKTIAVIGDSLSKTPLMEDWPHFLDTLIRESGSLYRVIAPGRGGLTIDQSYSVVLDDQHGEGPTFPSNSPLGQMIDTVEPDVIIYCVGGIDLTMLGDDPSAEFVKVRDNVISEINNLLPYTKVIICQYTPFDRENFPFAGTPPAFTTPLKYKGCSPWYIAQDYALGKATMDPAELDQPASANLTTLYENYEDFKQQLEGLIGCGGSYNVDAFIDAPMWKISRLGLCQSDLLHLTNLASKLMAYSVYESLRLDPNVQTALPDLMLNQLGQGAATNGFDTIWNEILTSDGTDGWIFGGGYGSGSPFNSGGSPEPITSIGASFYTENSTELQNSITSWTLHQRQCRVVFDEVLEYSSEKFVIEVHHAFPNVNIQWKLWKSTQSEPSSWSDLNVARYGTQSLTNNFGHWRGVLDTSSIASTGTYYFKLLVDADYFGPFELTAI